MPFKFFDFSIYPPQTAAALADYQGDVRALRRVDLGHDARLFVEKRFAVVGLVRHHLGVAVAEPAQHLGVAHLLAFYGAVDFFLESVGSHHVPAAAALCGVPQCLEFKEGLILEVTGLIKYHERVVDTAQVIHKVIVDIGVASLGIHAKLSRNLAYELEFGLDLGAVDIDSVAVVLHIAPGGEGLSDVRKIAEYAAEARLLAELKLGRDVLEGRGVGRLPFDFAPEADAQLAGDADPVGVAEHPVGLSVLDGTVDRGRDAEGGGVLGIARVVPARALIAAMILFLISVVIIFLRCYNVILLVIESGLGPVYAAECRCRDLLHGGHRGHFHGLRRAFGLP